MAGPKRWVPRPKVAEVVESNGDIPLGQQRTANYQRDKEPTNKPNIFPTTKIIVEICKQQRHGNANTTDDRRVAIINTRRFLKSKF